MTPRRLPSWHTVLIGHISLICPILLNKKMKRYTYYIIILLSAVFFTGCGEAENEYSDYPCLFRFDNTGNKSPALASAINSMSPGIFCCISVEDDYYRFTTNQGLSDRVPKTWIAQQATTILGQYPAYGIIVGYGTLRVSNAKIDAYDSLCPNCLDNEGLYKKISMASDGTAECPECHRKYDMNNGGLVISDEGGKRLIYYNATSNGTVLYVNN